MNYKIKNKQKYILEIIIIFFITIQGCKSNSNPVDIQPPKDPRTYTWTADTLSFSGSAQVLMRSIWGSSAKDVYTVGHNDQSLGVMWHYDGNKWTDVKLNYPFQGGNIIGSISLTSIYGFSSSDIYAVGLGSNNLARIIHYNGTAWTDVNLPSVGGWLNTVYGTSSSNVWAGGENALYHFDGSKWTRDSIGVIVPAGSFFQFTALSSYNSDILGLGLTDDNKANFTQYFLKYYSNKMNVVDSIPRKNGYKFGNVFWKSNTGALYSGSSEVFKFDGVNWTSIFRSGNVRKISGTNDNNIFVVGDFGLAYHFNGTDWQNIAPMLSKDTRTLYTAVWTDGTEAFIAEQPQTGFPQKTVIWHGK